MPDITLDKRDDKSQGAIAHTSSTVSRTNVIESGLQVLNELGANHICKVCIANSGSCCNGCRNLLDGVGCQLRNTSCTAWLCGFHKYLLYEVEQLEGWHAFWDQVPGQDYREDFTPEQMTLEKTLYMQQQTMDHLGEALAADLQEMERSHIAIGIILTLREKLDKNIDLYMDGGQDHKKRLRLKRKIKVLSSDFQRFHFLLNKFHMQQAEDQTT
ncbi:hypothetical protein BK133_11850 [Paenibacillus sp. FSL H8-0548]|uniref:hypothetical protein n=1 Tax=Paenibacillus sp. FSL H8-0548 TaxID=1920422 RepID=UPI00096BDC26|nr:hypothetical protein [Paenibacillus sp. FSL H8-0548]OMF34697.1 hypothetical protein BK133_11850 [Paenibacillus sp. FSL H8-0548]